MHNVWLSWSNKPKKNHQRSSFAVEKWRKRESPLENGSLSRGKCGKGVERKPFLLSPFLPTDTPVGKCQFPPPPPLPTLSTFLTSGSILLPSQLYDHNSVPAFGNNLHFIKDRWRFWGCHSDTHVERGEASKWCLGMQSSPMFMDTATTATQKFSLMARRTMWRELSINLLRQPLHLQNCLSTRMKHVLHCTYVWPSSAAEAPSISAKPASTRQIPNMVTFLTCIKKKEAARNDRRRSIQLPVARGGWDKPLLYMLPKTFSMW